MNTRVSHIALECLQVCIVRPSALFQGFEKEFELRCLCLITNHLTAVLVPNSSKMTVRAGAEPAEGPEVSATLG